MPDTKLSKAVIPMCYAWDMLSGARKEGLDMMWLAKSVGLDGEALIQQLGHITIDQYGQLMVVVRDQLQDEFIGFLNNTVPMKTFASGCYALAGCQNAVEAFQFSNRFMALFTDQVRWSWQIDESEACLYLHFKPTPEVNSRFSIHSLMLVPLRLLGWFIGESVPVSMASFQFENTSGVAADKFAFGKNILYGQEHNFIKFPAAIMQARINCNHQQVATLLHDTRGLFLFRQDLKPFSRCVRRLLIENRRQGWWPLSKIAQQLNMSEQNLWRKLKKEGSGYSEIRESLKCDWAKKLLEDVELSIAEVALELGFSEHSSFHKAFKRWSGQTPKDYRHTHGLR